VETVEADPVNGVIPTVHLLCGLPGSGKSTVARQIVDQHRAVRFTLDEWMLRLHGLAHDHPDYGTKAAECRELIWDTAADVLRAGTDVVLDWSQWSREQRAACKERAEAGGWQLVLHYIDVAPEIAITQAASRTAANTHRIDEAAVRQMVELLEPPSSDEGIEIIR
jgi:predicted kinase